MGLLIGASALTLVEVLDLFLYNIIVKLSDRRHTLKSVSDRSLLFPPLYIRIWRTAARG